MISMFFSLSFPPLLHFHSTLRKRNALSWRSHYQPHQHHQQHHNQESAIRLSSSSSGQKIMAIRRLPDLKYLIWHWPRFIVFLFYFAVRFWWQVKNSRNKPLNLPPSGRPPILILYSPFHPLLVLNLECSLINPRAKTNRTLSQGDPVCVGEEGSSWTSACPQARQEGNQGLHRLLVKIFPLWGFRVLLRHLFYHLSIFVCRCWSSLPTGVPIPWRCTRTQGPGTARQHQEDCLGFAKLEICGSFSFQILAVKDKTDQNKCNSMGGY